jgi:hypothetical protein
LSDELALRRLRPLPSLEHRQPSCPTGKTLEHFRVPAPALAGADTTHQEFRSISMHPLFRDLIPALAISWLAGCAPATLPSYPIEHPANPQAPMTPVTEPADSLTSSWRPTTDPLTTDTSPSTEHRHEKH